MNRFDYVKYDERSVTVQDHFKTAFTALAHQTEVMLPKGRAQALAITKLEEAYMWIGKAIRDAQIERNEGEFELQEERKDG